MTTFTHVALLGRQPEFGIVELESILGPSSLEPIGSHAVLLDSDLELNRLGGCIKLGRILYDGPNAALCDVVEPSQLPVADKKQPFAISYYGIRTTTRFVLSTGLELKNRLRHEGRSVRLIAPVKGTATTVAQLKHNRVVEEGFELLVIVDRQRMIVARTTAIQDIDWYSRRDYDRPARSAKVGMLPPKLAQILVNTTSAATVYDPFCGTGVIPQEAVLGGRRTVASDLAPEMTVATATNLRWLEGERPIVAGAWEVCGPEDARTATLPEGPVSITSEGYLGPNMTHEPKAADLALIRSDLLELYRDVLANWARQLPAGAELSLCVPAWRTGRSWTYLGVVDALAELGYTMKVFKHAASPLLYARDDQIVGRQVLLIRKT